MIYVLAAVNTFLLFIVYSRVAYITRYFQNAERMVKRQVEDERASKLYTYHGGGGYEH